MLKLRFDVSAALSVKLVIYERICTEIGFMMVGLLTTAPLYVLQKCWPCRPPLGLQYS